MPATLATTPSATLIFPSGLANALFVLSLAVVLVAAGTLEVPEAAVLLGVVMVHALLMEGRCKSAGDSDRLRAGMNSSRPMAGVAVPLAHLETANARRPGWRKTGDDSEPLLP
jgi:hypothetical protein